MAAFVPIAALVSTLLVGPMSADRWRPPELYVHERTPSSSSDELEKIALRYLGRPYVMGGVGSPGFDCSGFTCRVYAEAGYAIPRVSRDQARAGREAPKDRLLPGDLLFFAATPGGSRIGHVGMYLGDGSFVHASTTDGKVEIAELSSGWFSRRFVTARRLLPESGSPSPVRTSSTAPLRVESFEMFEHSGEDELPMMLRLPPKHPTPAFGPVLGGVGPTSIGLRSAVVTERHVAGFVLAPEAALRFDSIALAFALAVPIRFEIGQAATVGPLDTVADATRFLRHATLGLRGADLQLRLSRFEDATLGGGIVLDRYVPSAAVHGIPGLSVDRPPLSFFGAVRTDAVEVQSFVDDVVDPALGGAHVLVPIVPRTLRAGGGISTDQRARHLDARRAVNAVDAEVALTIVETPKWSLELGLDGAALHALGELGYGGRAGALVEHRFGGGEDALRLAGRVGWSGPGFLESIFGPTYAVAREAHLAAIAEAGGRPTAGGEVLVDVGSFTLGASYADAFGAERRPLDRQAALLLEVAEIPFGGTRVASLRASYAARALFTGAERRDVLFGGLRVRFASWLLAEVYVQKGDSFEGGGGVTVSFAP